MGVMVGMTVTAALTDYMSVTSYRGMQSKSIEFIDGELKENPIVKLKKEKHGLSVKMIPSEKYLGKIELTLEMIQDYLRRMGYLIPEGLKIIFYGKKSENDKVISRTYTHSGLSQNVEYLSQTLEFPPVEISFISDNFDLITSFSYDKSVDDIVCNSYCNYVFTTEGGNHEVSAQRAICEFFSREAKKLDPNSKYEVIYDDCRKGLVMAVNCRHVDPAFEGQHKTKVSNKDVLQEGKRGLNEALTNYFNNDNALLRKIITYLRQISKIRSEACKIKGISMKKPTTFLDDAEIKSFNNISDRNYSGYKELIISEGESAGGSLLHARNAKFQAVYGLRGVTDNVHGLTPAQLIQKDIFRNIIKILGCGVGKDFDINKLKWDKVIICTDKHQKLSGHVAIHDTNLILTAGNYS